MTVGIGLIGAGAMGADHLAILARDVAGARVAAVADTDTARVSTLVEQLGLSGAEITADPYRLVGLPQVDAVLVASPDDTHHDLVLACLDLGKPVLCEKPLATTSHGCRRIVDREIEVGRRLIQLGYMRRFDPGYVEMKRALGTGRVGAALMLHCRHRNATALPWFTPEMPLLNSAVHEIDAVRWLLDADVTRVSVYDPRSTRHAATGMADPRLVVLETSSGAVVDIEVFVNARYGYDVRCELVAEDGTLSLIPPAPLRTRTDGTEGTAIADDFRERFADAYRRQLQHWVGSIRDDVATGASAWDGYAASRTAEACVSAAATGRAIDLEPAEIPPLYARSSTASITSHH
ncbi:MAG: Gfo/Idh/MocA family oxidoreductase [Pseudonocardia sp.]|nr:Gfo/Idh/MocA family oxidoreductase [Pseudonocardia sp.]